MSRRRLPIGIQTFRTLREQDCYYVDKTTYLERLINEGTHYFLSRPRRFGKSLFLDTLKEFFAGNEALFAGLHIHRRHDWSQRHPVLGLREPVISWGVLLNGVQKSARWRWRRGCFLPRGGNRGHRAAFNFVGDGLATPPTLSQ